MEGMAGSLPRAGAYKKSLGGCLQGDHQVLVSHLTLLPGLKCQPFFDSHSHLYRLGTSLEAKPMGLSELVLEPP